MTEPASMHADPVVRAVVLDAMGVIYTAQDDVAELLIPFARAHGSDRRRDQIYDSYRRCSLGEFDSARLWSELGVNGDAAELDASYVERHRLQDGLREFVVSVQRRGLRLACISNDVAAWSQLLRHRHGLDELVPLWIVSADVGVRKPDLAIFEAFTRRSGLHPRECLFVDDQPKNVTAAQRLGFRTLHFIRPDTGPNDDEQVASLAEVSARIDQWRS